MKKNPKIFAPETRIMERELRNGQKLYWPQYKKHWMFGLFSYWEDIYTYIPDKSVGRSFSPSYNGIISDSPYTTKAQASEVLNEFIEYVNRRRIQRFGSKTINIQESK